MTITRRDFLRDGSLGAVGSCTLVDCASPSGRTPKPYFGAHPFITSHPKAVFIRRTRVAHLEDAAAKLREGLALTREIFVPLDRPGTPITHRIVLKPNVLSARTKDRLVWGLCTDPQFYEGTVLGLKELGLKKFSCVEANAFHCWNYFGFVDINERLGIEMNEPDRRARHFREDHEMTWSKVPDAVVYTRIPHYAPVNEPDTWLLNIAKWKSHPMCLTQSVKNEQGLVVLPYVRFCAGWRMVGGVPDFMKGDIHPHAEVMVNKFFDRHVRLNYARYDSRAELSPIHQEIWAQKTCDNMSVLKTGLAMIEAIYARDPEGEVHLTNLVMFGMDKFRLDVIGLYLGGHEPGNIHLYRIAKERGLSDTFNPWDIPIYEWVGGRAVARKLTDLERTPMRTVYLPKESEPEYHLVNEPFDYERYKI